MEVIKFKVAGYSGKKVLLKALHLKYFSFALIHRAWDV